MRTGLLSLLLLTACTGVDRVDAVEIWWIDSFRVPCTGVAPMQCMQVHDGEQVFGQWRRHYGEIAGFDFEPGMLVRLKLRRIELPPGQVPADAPSIRYELLEVLERRADPRYPLHDVFVADAAAGSGPQAWVEFNIVQRRYAGQETCRTFEGEIRVLDEQRLELGPPRISEAGCPDSRREFALLTRFDEIREWRRDGMLLRLLDGNAMPLLELRKVD